jgi:hypothetical protein
MFNLGKSSNLKKEKIEKTKEQTKRAKKIGISIFVPLAP